MQFNYIASRGRGAGGAKVSIYTMGFMIFFILENCNFTYNIITGSRILSPKSKYFDVYYFKVIFVLNFSITSFSHHVPNIDVYQKKKYSILLYSSII